MLSDAKRLIDIDYVDKHFVPIERYNQLEKEIEELKKYEKYYEEIEELIKERAKEIVYVDKNFIRKDKIKPIQIIDLDGKIHNVYKIEEE